MVGLAVKKGADKQIRRVLMPRSLTQYRVFIGSPGGLNEERRRFRDLLEKFTKLHAEPNGVTFHPVGWEDTIGGVGRPQELINEDLRQCDFALFVFHDRWGTPTGSGHTSGTEEEWEIAEELYKETRVRNIALFFRDVDSRQRRDPGDQLKRVLEFKEQIKEGKKYLFKAYAGLEEFCDALEGHLAKWLRDHTGNSKPRIADELEPIATPAFPAGAAASGPAPAAAPDFDYWITEAEALIEANEPNYAAVLFCAEKALDAASSDIEWTRARFSSATAQFYLNKLYDAIATFTEIVERPGMATDASGRSSQAMGLIWKGFSLSQLGRAEEAIAVYDDVVARFGAASELALRERVARALVYKGGSLGRLDRNEDAIAVYDDVVARFGTAPELDLREQVATALVSKGVRLGRLDRNEDAITVYDDVVARFGTAPELALREPIARALVNKGGRLGRLDRSADAIDVYDDVVARFGTAPELALNKEVAIALVNQGVQLGRLDRSADAIAVYDDVVARFGTAPELALRESVARALVNKGVALGRLDRNADAIAVYDDVVGRFGTAPELALREPIARALVNKGGRLGRLDRNEDAIAVYDDVVARFGTAAEPTLVEIVERAKKNKENALRLLAKRK